MSAEAEPKGRQHLGESTAGRRQHDAGPHVDDANPRARRSRRRGFPLAPNLREKVVARTARFGNRCIAPIAVVADRGARQERCRASLEPSECFAQ